MPNKASGSGVEEHVKTTALVSFAGGEGTENNQNSILDLLIVVAERKRLVLSITATLAVGSLIVSFILPRRYTATVTLLPPAQNSSMAAALTAQLGSLNGMAALAGGGLGLKNPNDMYVGMFKSRTVEDGMIQRFNLAQEYGVSLASDARKIFQRRTAVDGSGKDGLIHISVEDRDPRRAAELANGYVEQYRSLSEHLATTEAAQRRLFFERQLETAKDNLANSEEAMKKTEQKTGMLQLDSQARALIESAASLRAQIAAKEVEIQSMATFATGENSQYVQAQQELRALQAQLAKLGGSDTGSDVNLIMPTGRVSEAGLDYVRRLRDVKYNEVIFDILARQYEIAKLDEAKEGSLIQVVDAATPPDKPSSPRRALITIAGTAFGLIIGIFVALLSTVFQRMEDQPELSEKIRRLRKALSVSSGGFRRDPLRRGD